MMMDGCTQETLAKFKWVLFNSNQQTYSMHKYGWGVKALVKCNAKWLIGFHYLLRGTSLRVCFISGVPYTFTVG